MTASPSAVVEQGLSLAQVGAKAARRRRGSRWLLRCLRSTERLGQGCGFNWAAVPVPDDPEPGLRAASPGSRAAREGFAWIPRAAWGLLRFPAAS